MMRGRRTRPCRLGVAVRVAGRSGERAIREHALELIGLAGLIAEERAGRGMPRQRVGRVELQVVAAVAAKVAVLEVPQLASRAGADVRRSDEDRRVVGEAER